MWELDIKNAEHRRINSFELRCWRRLLRVPWTARRANQSILEEINPGYLLEGLVLKFHLMWRPDSLEKTLMLAKIKSKRSRQRRMRWLDSVTDSIDTNWSKLQETVGDRGAWRATVHGVIKRWLWLSDWTTAYPFWRADVRGREVTVDSQNLYNRSHCPQRQRWSKNSDSSCPLEVTEWRLGDLCSELLRKGFIYLVDSLTWWHSKVFQL